MVVNGSAYALFDLDSDPREQINLLLERNELVAEMLDKYLAHINGPWGFNKLKLSKETKSVLIKQGYWYIYYR
jgi:hypothetical protein